MSMKRKIVIDGQEDFDKFREKIPALLRAGCNSCYLSP